MTRYSWTASDKNGLQDAYNTGGGAAAYTYVNNLMNQAAANGYEIDKGAQRWVQAAININQDAGWLSSYTRTYLALGGLLNGVILTPSQIQAASNTIAYNYVQKTITDGQFLTTEQTVNNDIRVVTDRLGLLDDDWPGILAPDSFYNFDFDKLVNNPAEYSIALAKAMIAGSIATGESIGENQAKLADWVEDQLRKIADDFISPPEGQLPVEPFGPWLPLTPQGDRGPVCTPMNPNGWIPQDLLPAMDGGHSATFPRLDGSPLVIDMDGDGVELTDLNTNPVYWDVDNNGFKDASAWVQKDDALLVMDRNGNGKIDNHSELFGTLTVDGFTILRQLDSNSDNKIDAGDAQFSSLKVWQDLNQDGVSQANELRTLNDAGVQSISLNADSSVYYEIAGNAITHTSQVTMSDGSIHSVVDAWFKYNDTNTSYAGDYTLDTRTLYLPTLRGYGDIKSLHIAMSQDEVLLQKVATVAKFDLAHVLDATNDFDGKFRDVIYRWGGTEDETLGLARLEYDVRKTDFLDMYSGREYRNGIQFFDGLHYYQPTYLFKAWQSALTALEARFLAQTVFKPLFSGEFHYNVETDVFSGITGLSSSGLSSIATLIDSSSDKNYSWTLVVRVIEGIIGIDNLSGADRSALDSAIQADLPNFTLDILYLAVDKGLESVVQAPQNQINNMIGTGSDDLLSGANMDDTFDGGYGDDRFYGYTGNDTYRGGFGDDFYCESFYGGGNDIYIYDGGHDLIEESYYGGTDKLVFGLGIKLSDLGMQKLNYTDPSSLDIYHQADLVITVKDLGDITLRNQYDYYGNATGASVDTIEFADGSTLDLVHLDDMVYGTNGNDTITGADRSYFLNDRIEALDGNDTINGGLGRNYLDGGWGNDTYTYGGGLDIIVDADGNDTIVLPSSYNLNDLELKVVGAAYASSDYALKIYYQGELIIHVKNQFWFGAIESITNGTNTINLATRQYIQEASAEYTYILGIQYGGNTNNIMYGTNLTSDRIASYDGNDVLEGKMLDDRLEGGAGNDTYVYNRGDGLDYVIEESGIDTISFGANITLSDISIQRNSSNENSLDILLNGSLITTIENHFNVNKTIETIQFSNATTLDLSVYHNIEGTTGSDALFGLDNSLILGDLLKGYEGNDTLTGGAGSDNLQGGAGDDTYVYTSGVDTITEWSGNDTILFGAGILANNITFVRDPNRFDLNISINGQLSVIIKYQHENGENSIVETIRFYDNSTLNLTTMVYTINGTSGGEYLSGSSSAVGGNIINGFGGDDTLSAYSTNDTLDGGSGSDTVMASLGNDTLIYAYKENVGYSDNYYAQQGSDTLKFYIESANLNDVILSDLIAYKNFLTIPANNNVDEPWGAQYSFTSFGLYASGFEILKIFIDGVEQSLSSISNIIGTSSAETLNGTTGMDILSGKDGNDILNGNNGNDILIGGAGADTMTGGAGDDTYNVDNASDSVVEASGGGADLVVSAITYTLGLNVENLTLEGTSAINATGNTQNNVIIGNVADNTISGGTGTDTMVGGLGNDIYIVDSTSDIVTEATIAGTDTIQTNVTLTGLVANVENITLTGTSALNATGNALDNVITGNTGNNTLTGNDGNDTIIGGGGVDTMIGGQGNDLYTVDSTTDIVTEALNAGIDTIQTNITLTSLVANVDNITLTGTGAISATGNALDNVITGNTGNNTLTGNDGNDTLIGGGGTDTMVGGLGNDIYVVDSTSDIVTEAASAGTDTIQSSVTIATMTANVENLILTGTTAINVTGNGLNNTLTGNSGDNTISGGTGSDIMSGGLGNDIYIVDNILDGVLEDALAGTDLVQSSVSYVLSANIENITLTGSSAINATGNLLDNIITGNTGNNILIGGGGNDTLIGGTGNDTYIIDSAGDIVTELASAGADTVKSSLTYTLALNVENLVLLGSSNIDGTGNTLANTLTGNAGNNILDGSTGADTMIGAQGNDIYIVDSTSDVVTEAASEGTDLIKSSVTYTASANVENITLTGLSTVNATGNALDNILTGNTANNTLTANDGNDTLDGGAGNDTMVGGLGNDTYIVDSISDVITEAASAGTDLIKSSVTYMASANVENITLTASSAVNATGNALDNILIGNTGNNTLTANDGNDTLDGGAGNDTMVGGLGNDTYIVESISDVVTEAASAGTDLVKSYITLTLGANLENMTLIGLSAINATGNAVNNILTGNSANNILDGAAGNDTMIGGLGDDKYIVDSLSDVITEAGNAGIDTVETSLAYTLGANLENLTLTGSTIVNGTGNALNNVLIGNSANNTLTGADGNDTLDGGLGNDTMVGGLGDDTFIMNVSTDIVTETSGQGTDTVKTNFTYTLITNFENLTLLGSSAINGTGNTLANILTGNSANNTLNGGDGNDTLIGGGGNDTLIGALGNDTFVYGEGLVIISETSGGSDILNVANGSTINDITTSQIGNNAKIVIASGISEITLTNQHHATTAYHIEKIQFNDGFITTLEDHLLWMKGTSGNNTITGTAAHNTIIGYAGNDTLDGAGGDDDIHGGIGNDLIKGGSGVDLLHGGVGNDILYGQDGLDTLYGGDGIDTFVFEAGTAFNNIDVIKDFSLIDGDRISLSDLLTGYGADASDINDFVSAASSGSNTNLFVDRDGSGSTYSSIQIATLNNVSELDIDSLLINKNLLV